MHPIYIEATDEITTVIDRLKHAQSDTVALVVPKGAIIVQSIVNLKLARKAAADLGKGIVLVTTDSIGKNLAGQVGIPVVPRLEEADDATVPSAEDDAKVIAGVKVHRYYEEESAPEASAAVDPIIPKKLFKASESAAPAAPVEETVIKKREIATNDAEPVMAAAAAAAVLEPSESSVEPIAAKSRPARAASRKAAMFGAYLLLLLLLAAGGVGAFYLPKTDVTVTVPAQAWEREVSVTAKTGNENSSSQLTVAAQALSGQAHDSVTIQATGSKDIGETAKGTATLYNYDSTAPETVPAGVVITAGGHSFTTQAPVTVPGFTKAGAGAPLVPGSKTVEIVANEAGDASNVTNAAANDVKGTGYSLSATVTASGGTSKQVAIVTQTDIANARAALTKKLQEASLAKLEEQMQGKDYIFQAATDAYSFDDYTISATAGSQAENVTATGNGTTKRLVIEKEALQTVVSQRILADADKSTSTVVDAVAANKIEINLADQSANLTVNANGHTRPSVDTELIRTQLVGKNRSDAESLVTALVKNAKVGVSQQPDWWPNKNFPYSSKYLNVTVAYE